MPGVDAPPAHAALTRSVSPNTLYWRPVGSWRRRRLLLLLGARSALQFVQCRRPESGCLMAHKCCWQSLRCVLFWSRRRWRLPSGLYAAGAISNQMIPAGLARSASPAGQPRRLLVSCLVTCAARLAICRNTPPSTSTIYRQRAASVKYSAFPPASRSPQAPHHPIRTPFAGDRLPLAWLVATVAPSPAAIGP